MRKYLNRSTWYTMQDDDGSIYPNEFMTISRNNIDDDMCKRARMGRDTLQEFIDDGFRIVPFKFLMVEDNE